MENTIDKVHTWAERQGLRIERIERVPTEISVWPGTAISLGRLLYDAKAHPGDVLHELGHIALTPAPFRKKLTGDLGMQTKSVFELADELGGLVDEKWAYLNDTAIIGWSYFAALDAGVDTFLPFQPVAGDGTGMHERVKAGVGHPMGSAESCQLFYAGMLERKGGAMLTRFVY